MGFVHGTPEEYIQWKDQDGNIINASDGGMIYVDGKYYWYGLKLRPLPYGKEGEGGEVTTEGVVMYSSQDLYHWEYEGVILECSSDPSSELYGPLRFERPKIVYNDHTGQFVMWMHYVQHPGDHGRAIGTAEAGVASCGKVNGKYTWHGFTRPVDARGAVKDCTVFKDRDGKAYFIYDRVVEQDRCIHIVQLSEDYLRVTDQYKRIDVAYWREAPCVFYRDGYYYMLTSSISGWEANQARYYRAPSIWGPWEDMGDPYIEDRMQNSFHSQGTYVFALEDREMYIYMAERHNTENFERCSYIWLPVEFTEDGALRLSYREEWEL